MAKVLIVDDHALNREFLATLLGYRGDQVLQAQNGIEALALTRSEHPDLVITDILMPEMDGYEYVRHLRSDPSIAHTPVIFCSAFYHETDAHDLAKTCGVEHVLGKPCQPEIVLKVVEATLQESAAPAVHSPAEFDREHLRVVTGKLVSMASDLSQVNERLARLIETNLHLASIRKPRQLLDNMCDGARRLIGARHALLAVRESVTGLIYCASCSSDAAPARKFELESLEHGELGKVLRERRSRRGLGIVTDALGLPGSFPSVDSFVAAPIASIVRSYGWICLTDKLNAEEFTEEDERLLGILSAQVGRIYENGSIYAELQEKEERFRQMADHINEVFFLTNPDNSQMLYVNAGFEKVWGRSRDALYANPRLWMEQVYPEDAKIAREGFRRMQSAGEVDATFRIVRKDGVLRWIRVRGFPIRNATGDIYRVAGLAEDVTASHEAEIKIRRLNRVYAVLSGINNAIVRVRDQRQLFNEVCRIAVVDGRFRMCWIGLLDESNKLVPQAVEGHDDGYLRFIEGLMSSEYARSLGCMQALSHKRAVIRNNLQLDTDSPWNKEVITRGYRAAATFPLVVADRAIGMISLYASDPDFFDTGEIKLLNELAQDIAFAMEFMENERRMKYIAFNDALTGLPNRAFLRRNLESLLASSQKFALMLLNMNGFRDINNTLGHHNGDELLRQIAQRLQGIVWGKDVVAALGGDDFGILLPGLKTPEEVDVVLDKVLQSLQGSFNIAGIPIRVEAALGIAMYPEHGGDVEKLWRCADVALRAAKETHRPHQFYRAQIDRFDPRQLGLMGELRDAITNGELVLHYQPIIDLKTARPVGVEALVRWQSPAMGLIFPDKFIPLAEQTELINPLTVWVLEHALSQVSAWRDQGFPLDLSVNLSARSLQSRDMFNSIVAIIEATRMQFPFLTLEITESAIMGDPENAREMLGQLRGMGIGLAVDDYGIGQSSLNYLKSLPVSKLKIDKSFVMDFANPSNEAIVRSTIDLAHNLGLTVIAEGVEDENTFLALGTLACDRAQGYYFSRALPAAPFVAWLNGYRKPQGTSE